jgi:hypothetical protein
MFYHFIKKIAYKSIRQSSKEQQMKGKKKTKDRCWAGYEPTPGKKAYSPGSCRPIKKSGSKKSK